MFINVTWELQHAFITPEPFPANAVNIAWFLLDLGLFWQLLKHAPSALAQRGLPRVWTGPLVALGVLLAHVWHMGFDLEFANRTGEYSAFVESAVMSAFFVHWGVTAPNLRGQRVSIALTKCIGTALYVAPVYSLTGSRLLLAQGLVAVLLDVVYVCILRYRTSTEQHPGGIALVIGKDI